MHFGPKISFVFSKLCPYNPLFRLRQVSYVILWYPLYGIACYSLLASTRAVSRKTPFLLQKNYSCSHSSEVNIFLRVKIKRILVSVKPMNNGSGLSELHHGNLCIYQHQSIIPIPIILFKFRLALSLSIFVS